MSFLVKYFPSSISKRVEWPSAAEITISPGYSLPVDPEFEKGKTYEYTLLDKNKLKFELCATFSLPMPKGWQEYQGYNGGGIIPMEARDSVAPGVATNAIYPYPSGTNDTWDHQTGRTCFERTIDKDLYPPYPKVLKN